MQETPGTTPQPNDISSPENQPVDQHPNSDSKTTGTDSGGADSNIDSSHSSTQSQPIIDSVHGSIEEEEQNADEKSGSEADRNSVDEGANAPAEAEGVALTEQDETAAEQAPEITGGAVETEAASADEHTMGAEGAAAEANGVRLTERDETAAEQAPEITGDAMKDEGADAAEEKNPELSEPESAEEPIAAAESKVKEETQPSPATANPKQKMAREERQAKPAAEEAEPINLEGKTAEQLYHLVLEALHHPEVRANGDLVNAAKDKYRELSKAAKAERAHAENQSAITPENADQPVEGESATTEASTSALEETQKGAEPGGPTPELDTQFEQAVRAFRDKRTAHFHEMQQQREVNFTVKNALLDEFKLALEEEQTTVEGINAVMQKVKHIQERWRSVGGVPQEKKELLSNRYQAYLDRFKGLRNMYSQMFDADRQKNLELRNAVIAKIEALATAEGTGNITAQLKQYAEDYKKIGAVPREVSEEVHARFRAAMHLVISHRDSMSEENRHMEEQNYAAKLEIIARMKEIAEVKDNNPKNWKTRNDEISKWNDEWKKVGRVPLSKRDELRAMFQEVIKTFNTGRKEFYKDRKKEQGSSVKQKEDLIARAEEILKDENASARKKEIMALQDEWKQTGPVPKAISQQLWDKFHGICDAFFNKLHGAKNERSKEEQDNLKQKNQLIARAEALVESDPNPEDLEVQIKEIQSNWRDIGFVPYKEKEKVSKRYFKAMDTLTGGRRFNEGGGADVDSETYQTLVANWKTDPTRIQQEERKLLRDIRTIEGEIATLENNMEFLSNSRSSGNLKKTLEAQIEKMRERLNGLNGKMKSLKEARKPAKQPQD